MTLRRLVSVVDRNEIAFVFLDGSTTNSQPPTLNPHHLGSLRFFASVRLGMERMEWIRRGRDVIGCRTLVRVIKNKLAPPCREAEVELLFYRFPPDAPVLQICRPGRESAGLNGASRPS